MMPLVEAGDVRRSTGPAPVSSESTPSWRSPPWPYWRRRPLGLLPRLLVPQVVLLLVDGIVIGLYVLGLGTPGDVQVLADVGLGCVFGLPATRSTSGCSARTRAGAAAADSPQSGSPSRPVPTLTTQKAPASPGPVEDRSPPPHTPAPQARIERSCPRSSTPAGPESPHSPNRAQSAN